MGEFMCAVMWGEVMMCVGEIFFAVYYYLQNAAVGLTPPNIGKSLEIQDIDRQTDPIRAWGILPGRV